LTTTDDNLSLHDALPICRPYGRHQRRAGPANPPRIRPELHHRQRHEGWRAKGRISCGGCAMSVLVNEKTKLIVQGFTGREGTFQDRKSTRLNSSHEWISY